MGPDGGSFNGLTVNITDFGGISGVVDTSSDSCLALMGVFTAGTLNSLGVAGFCFIRAARSAVPNDRGTVERHLGRGC